jgi:nucleotide-binding universal stress UspA family protein
MVVAIPNRPGCRAKTQLPGGAGAAQIPIPLWPLYQMEARIANDVLEKAPICDTMGVISYARGKMSGIVCAIRGGPDSQATIAQAITLAQETGLPLYFLYVVNLDFLTHTTSSRVHTISEQMHQMAEFILLTAQASASNQGVRATGVVRHGNVGEEIVGLCHELAAEYLVLGWPRVQHEESVFTQELLRQFIERTEEQTGAKVILPEGGDR